MDNWLFLILSLILAYLLEFTRPWVKSYFAKWSLSWHERRISVLVTRYQYLMKLKESSAQKITALFIWVIASSIFLILSIATFVLLHDLSTNVAGVLYGTMGVFYSISLLVGLVIACFLWWSVVKDMVEVSKFENYTKETIKKLIKLGGDPEDLDKEEG